ncbi:Na(+)/H(+) exchange regulatory cofactor NHE-RF3 [Melanotaenia boesemani]|uniref:Na(+)/H(+) exchange regulatory cofactor NHE-RF3 n=1 Tax=Melanotaenia boesemani TaxID=1250792 RepID=UPI001C04F715|nr:Na(+)/H(+) exchange regulatory cofactor NHE-RF3 [Melanotaenia boesemani]XP_041857961.1 Na(+)/H(+) exchange regulatory cofactor NHE-RF3 [Melanotaenia boesemani]XP_041857962.1 Na(+)/H(+) exchange regulatory cofactor NHE-RF3 [Melanotaenia boesemani]
MATYKPRVISLTKRPGQTFGFYLRVEQSEEGHLIRCLEMGGPAELAGMKDGDRILRVNGTFVDELSHSEVVELVRNSGASVTFHVLDESSYKQAKSQGINLSDPKSRPVLNGVSKEAPKPKLCYLVKSSSGFEFSLRSVRGEQGLFMTEVISGGVAHRAGVRVKDRLLEINGENVENLTHDQVVEKIRQVGNSMMFLLTDEETDKFYQSKQTKIGAWLATVKYLPHTPRIINMTKGSDGYGFLLREEPKQPGHFIKDIDRDSPAERGGLKEMDRVVAVEGKQVESCTHEQVVDTIKQSGDSCCLLVVDKDTDQMYKLGDVSPMLFLEEMKNSNSPPSYIEAMTDPPVQPSTPVEDSRENLRPKLCQMEKAAAGYGFHLNGIQGVCGQYIEDVVKGGAADEAGLENGDIVVEVNGVNVEQRGYDEVVEMIRSSGNNLEMLVASKNVYKQLKGKGVTITRHLLEETHYARGLTADSPTISEKKKQEEARPETLTDPERKRTSSVSSSSSASSMDERL